MTPAKVEHGSGEVKSQVEKNGEEEEGMSVKVVLIWRNAARSTVEICCCWVERGRKMTSVRR